MRWALAMLAMTTTTTMTAVTTACDDPCTTRAEGGRSAELGLLRGASTFEPLAEGATVVLGFAPQGGQGVFTAVRTVGLEAHQSFGIFSKGLDAQVRIVDETSGERDVLGEFFTSSFISCVEGEGGVATEIVFGLDAARFGFGFGSDPGTDAALQAIDGHTVSLEADLVDDNNAELPIARAVVLDAAPDSIENP